MKMNRTLLVYLSIALLWIFSVAYAFYFVPPNMATQICPATRNNLNLQMSRRGDTKLEKRERNIYYARLNKQSGEAATKRKEAILQQKRDTVNDIEREFCAQVWEYTSEEERQIILPAAFSDVLHKLRDEFGRRPEVMPKLAAPSNDTESIVAPGSTTKKITKTTQNYKQQQGHQANKKLTSKQPPKVASKAAKKRPSNGDGGYLRA